MFSRSRDAIAFSSAENRAHKEDHRTLFDWHAEDTPFTSQNISEHHKLDLFVPLVSTLSDKVKKRDVATPCVASYPPCNTEQTSTELSMASSQNPFGEVTSTTSATTMANQTMQTAPFTVQNRQFPSFSEALDYSKTIADKSDLYAYLLDLNKQATAVRDIAEDYITNLLEVVDANDLEHYVGKPDFEADFPGIRETAARVKNRRDEKTEAINRLRRATGWQQINDTHPLLRDPATGELRSTNELKAIAKVAQSATIKQVTTGVIRAYLRRVESGGRGVQTSRTQIKSDFDVIQSGLVSIMGTITQEQEEKLFELGYKRSALTGTLIPALQIEAPPAAVPAPSSSEASELSIMSEDVLGQLGVETAGDLADAQAKNLAVQAELGTSAADAFAPRLTATGTRQGPTFLEMQQMEDVIIDDPQDLDEGRVLRSRRIDTNQPGSKRRRQDDDMEEGDAGAESAVARVGLFKGCYCSGISEETLRVIEQHDSSDHGSQNLFARILELVDSAAEDEDEDFTICMRHLRVPLQRVGYKIHSASKRDLIGYMREFRDGNPSELRRLHPTSAHFKPAFRPTRDIDSRGLYQYRLGQLPSVAVHGKQMIDSLYPGRGYYEEWDARGTVNINAFDWWFTNGPNGEAPLSKIFLEELEMYRYHLRVEGNDLGWLRNCFHSLAQQAMRQDPLYYALYAALRTDNATTLISYPYYCKYTLQSNKTSFRHLDNNPAATMAEKGDRLIQGSLSLTDEIPSNCTELIPGMHKFSNEWWNDVVKRGGAQKATGLVVNMNDPKKWNKDDELKFGTKWEPVPCKAGEVRISQPHLAHGSTGPATNVRITMLPWFEKVEEDGQTLEIPGGGVWDDLSRAHRDLYRGQKTPSGLAVVHGTIHKSFPAAISLVSSSAISQALVGRIPWSDPRTYFERLTLFGDDAAARTQLIENHRAEIYRVIPQLYDAVKQAERLIFGERSFYAWKERGGNRPPMDDEDPEETEAHANEQNAEDIGVGIEEDEEMEEVD